MSHKVSNSARLSTWSPKAFFGIWEIFISLVHWSPPAVFFSHLSSFCFIPPSTLQDWTITLRTNKTSWSNIYLSDLALAHFSRSFISQLWQLGSFLSYICLQLLLYTVYVWRISLVSIFLIVNKSHEKTKKTTNHYFVSVLPSFPVYGSQPQPHSVLLILRCTFLKVWSKAGWYDKLIPW